MFISNNVNNIYDKINVYAEFDCFLLRRLDDLFFFFYETKQDI